MAFPPSPDPEAPPGLDRVAALARATSGPLAFAVSGGGDSVALLSLGRLAAPERPALALIVDHRLRPGSAEAAGEAAAIARGLGAEVEVLTIDWEGRRPTGQAAARAARYRVLCAAMRRRGLDALFVAHTADDQVETARLRSQARSGPYGMAGMAERAPAPVWPEGRGAWLIRPLLGVRRAALRAWLTRRGVPWIEDPANGDARFARVRARADISGIDGVAFRHALEAVADAAKTAAQIDRAALAALESLQVGENGDLKVDAGALEACTAAGARRRALAALIAAASGDLDPPSGAGLGRIERAPICFDACLGGAVLRRRVGRLAVQRDPGAVLGRGSGLAPIRRALDANCVFDGRFALAPRAPRLTLELRASSVAGVAILVSEGGAPARPLAQATADGLIEAEPLAREIVARVLWRAAITPP